MEDEQLFEFWDYLKSKSPLTNDQLRNTADEPEEYQKADSQQPNNLVQTSSPEEYQKADSQQPNNIEKSEIEESQTEQVISRLQNENNTVYNQEESPQSSSTPPSFEEMMLGIDREIKRVGGAVEYWRQYIIDKYAQRSRHFLKDSQLLEFWNYLKTLSRGSLPAPGEGI